MHYDPSPKTIARFVGALERRAPALARYLELGDVVTDSDGTDYVVVDTVSQLEMDTGFLLITHTIQAVDYE